MEKIIEILRAASAGLFFMSESDYPFTPVSFPAAGEPSTQKILQLTGHPADAPIHRVELSYFLRNSVREDLNPEAVRFKNLQQVLESNLKNVKVYRIGETQVQVYILGQTPEGGLAGLQTVSVET